MIGTKLHKKAMVALKHIFDHKKGHAVTSLIEVKERDNVMEWSIGLDDILTVSNSKEIDTNLIIKYLQLTLNDIRDSLANYHQQPTRATQNM